MSFPYIGPCCEKVYSFIKLALNDVNESSRLLRLFSGLTAENTTPSSLTVRWDPVQTVKRGETIEYLLQSQCIGKDQDFVQVGCSVKSPVIKLSFFLESCRVIKLE